MQPSLRWHERNCVARYIGRIGHYYADATEKFEWQGFVEIALVHCPAGTGQVATCALDRGRVEVRGMQSELRASSEQRTAERPGSATEVNNDRVARCGRGGAQQFQRRDHNELSSPPRYEHARID